MTLPSAADWKEGIYFGLDEKLYHSLPWAGSGDIKKLAFSPPDFWADSPMNPLREVDDKDTPARIFGSAIHCGILYGEEEFRNRYGYIEGDSGKEGPSAEGLKDWIRQQGGQPAKLKEDNERIIRQEFDTILLTEAQFNKVLVAHQTIKSNPYLVEAFSKGWPEVSIFWREEGVPCKCRHDYLKIKATVDLKSFSGRDRMMSVDRMILNDIFRYRYDAQAAHYLDGRLAGKRLLEEGAVFMGDAATRPSDDWLTKVFANEEPMWAFVFYKSDGATIAKSYQSLFKGPMIEAGRYIKRTALTNYQNFMTRFGTDAWVVADEPFQIQEDDLPKYL